MQSKIEELSSEVTGVTEDMRRVEIDVGAVANDVMGRHGKVTNLTKDVKGVQSNVGSLTTDVKGLTQNMTGITSSISTMAGNTGNVTQDVQRLCIQVKADNLSLQDTLVKKVQGLFEEFRADLLKTSEQEDSSCETVRQDSPTPRNIRHAGCTQFQANTLPSRTVRVLADEPNVTAMMQEIFEASNNRFDKLVDTLQGNIHASGFRRHEGQTAQVWWRSHRWRRGCLDKSHENVFGGLSRSERTKVLTLLTFLHKHAQATTNSVERQSWSAASGTSKLQGTIRLQHMQMLRMW